MGSEDGSILRPIAAAPLSPTRDSNLSTSGAIPEGSSSWGDEHVTACRAGSSERLGGDRRGQAGWLNTVRRVPAAMAGAKISRGASVPAAWVVAGCAVIVALAAPFVAAANTSDHPPSGPMGPQLNYLNAYSGPVFLNFLFSAPIASLVAASIAYVGLALNRPRIFAITAVLAGLAASYVVGGEIQAIAAWWLGVSHDTNRVAATLATVVSLLTVATVVLSVKLPVLRSATSRRGATATLLSIGVLGGLFIGVLVGGEAAVLTALQYTCPPGGPTCYGPGIESSLQEGAVTGTWFGGVAGLVAAVAVWALPPWLPSREHLSEAPPGVGDQVVTRSP